MKHFTRTKLFTLFMFLLIFMTVLFFYFLYHENDVDENSDSCFDNLLFHVKGTQKIETINCFYNECEGEGMYYLFLPSYADPEHITVQYNYADTIQFNSANEQILISAQYASCHLTPEYIYNVEFMDKDNTIIETGKLKVLQSKNLPTLYLTTESGSLDYLNENKNNIEPGFLVVYTTDGELEYCDELNEITGRGNETWQYDKRSYGVELNYESNLENMGSAKNWVLLPNVADDTYIRNKITYDMAAASGMAFSPDSCFVDLYVNNTYHGLYQLSEKVEIHRERLNIADLNLENKKLNSDQYTRGNIEQLFTNQTKYIDLSWEPNDISGGYLLERDYENKYAQELSGFQSSVLQDFYSIKSPKYASEQETAYICNLFNEMERAIASPDGVNPITGKTYSDYLDIDSFVTKYLIEEISRNNGGGASSAFYYKPQDSISEKIYAGPVWDYDKAYGSLRTHVDANTRDLAYLTLNRTSTELYWDLYQLPDFQQAVCDKYQTFFSNYLNYLTTQKIDEYVSEIEQSAEMDRLRWNGSNVRFNMGPNSLDENIQYLKTFISERKAFLDNVWGYNPQICTVHFIYSDIGYEKVEMRLGVIKGESLQSYPIPSQNSDGEIFKGWVIENSQEEFNPENPILNDITAIANFN